MWGEILHSVQHDREDIAEILKKLRKKAGFTQKQIGELTEKAPQTVASWENGKGQPDINTFLYLLKLYGVDDVYKQFGYSQPKDENSMFLSQYDSRYSLSEASNQDVCDMINLQIQQLPDKSLKLAKDMVQLLLYHSTM